MHNGLPVIGIRDTPGEALFSGNLRTLKVDALEQDQAIYNEQPVLGAVDVKDGRTLYNGQRVVNCIGGWRLPGSTLDADFVNNRLFGASSIASAFAISRASAGYADDASGVWSSFANGVLRRTSKGLLIEEGRTNGVRQSSLLGATPGAVGSGGAFPLGMSLFATAGLTTTIHGTGVENGIEYLELSISGTSSSTVYVLAFDTTAFPASPGQVFTEAIFASVVSGSLAGIVRFNTNLRQSGGTNPTADVPFSTLTGVLTRQPTSTYTLTTGATGVYAAMYLQVNTGAAIDIRLRLGWPQIELGAFSTSPIRTNGATASRAADVVTTTAAFNNSVHVEWTETVGPVSVNRTLWSAYIDASNYLMLRVGTDNKVHFLVVTGGVTQCDLVSTNAVVAGQTYKAAVRWGLNDFALRVSSALGSPANDNSGTPPAGTPAINLGNDGAGAGFLNGIVRRFAIQSARTDAQLATLVS